MTYEYVSTTLCVLGVQQQCCTLHYCIAYTIATYHNAIIVVLGAIKKTKWYGIAIKYLNITVLLLLHFLLVFCIFMTISAPQCINSHIKCSFVKLELAHGPAL